ncbi:MAG: DUF2721 domain-containing protein [Ignavibacteria bacterium]|nr:DUF2721 domain-containing protein [Ignavibacteria bacterium]
MMNPSIRELIQTMLAPGVMVNVCALMLLVTNNKYSAVVDRVRSLNEEKRDLTENGERLKSDTHLSKRLESVEKQLEFFQKRIPFIVRAVLAYTISIAIYVLTSLMIGFGFAFSLDLRVVTFITFLLGMICVLVGSIYLAREIIYGYKIVLVEIESK